MRVSVPAVLSPGPAWLDQQLALIDGSHGECVIKVDRRIVSGHLEVLYECFQPLQQFDSGQFHAAAYAGPHEKRGKSPAVVCAVEEFCARGVKRIGIMPVVPVPVQADDGDQRKV